MEWKTGSFGQVYKHLQEMGLIGIRNHFCSFCMAVAIFPVGQFFF
jgi:hypothetical protein